MKTQTYTSRPAASTFLKYFLLMFALFTVMIAGFYLLLSKGETFTEFLRSVWVLYFFLPLLNAASFAFASRKHQFVVEDMEYPARMANWAVELLQQNGLRVKVSDEHGTLLEARRKYSRMFNNWFGTELVRVSFTQNDVTVEGHRKYIDILDSRIKFGKPALSF